MTSRTLQSLIDAVPLPHRREMSIAFQDASVFTARMVRSVLHVFSDHQLEDVFPPAMTRLGDTVIVSGVELPVRGYRLYRHDDVVGMTVFIPNPLDPYVDSRVEIEMFTDPLSQPRWNISPHQDPSVAGLLSMVLFELIEAMYPTVGEVGYSRQAQAQLSKLAKELPRVGKDFDLYIAPDGLHLRSQGKFVAQWLTPR